MSDYFDADGVEPGDEPTEDEAYEQYLAAVAQAVDEFEELYGFRHECHCKEDWENNDVGLVSKCYTEMVHDALNKCHEYKGMVAELERNILTLQMQVRENGDEPRV